MDMGTNVGIQIRKVYEQNYYPRSPIRWHFEDVFMDERPENICTIGFEPNTLHVQRLVDLQGAYQKANFPCVIFTTTAVTTYDGNITFYRSKENAHYHEAGASTIAWDGVFHDNSESAVAVDINAFVWEVVHLWKKSQSYSETSRLVAKMDIEGAEYTVLPHMLAHGSLCHFTELIMEWHSRFFPNATSDILDTEKNVLWATKLAPHCNFKFIEVDDNTYADGKDPNPFPAPKNESSRLFAWDGHEGEVRHHDHAHGEHAHAAHGAKALHK